MIYRATHDLRNIPELFHCYTIIEYLIFGVYLLSVLHSSAVKMLLVFVSILFIAFCLYILTQERLEKFDSVQASVSAIILIAFCIIYLFEQINKPEPTFIYSSYTFWIITAILIYLAATLFLYGFASSLPTDVAQDYWVISQISNVLKNILISVAIIIYSKSSKTPKAPPPVGTDYQPYLN
jgi:drug/metabolite transporter (DMT)-like permease